MLGLFFAVVLIVLAIFLLIFFSKVLIIMALGFAGIGLWHMGGTLGLIGLAVVVTIGLALIHYEVIP